MHKIFIDGSAGTAGLQIFDRLSKRDDLALLTLSDPERKDLSKRREALNSCDLAVLCLPDEAAAEAVSLIENPDVRVIDCSTAHRTAPGWVYGFPEISPGGFEKIANAKRVTNPGCHACGFIALVAPLIEAGILPKSALISCTSVTGYSGGGKKMIAEYEDLNRAALYAAPRQYGLAQTHKHLKEMRRVCGLDNPPAFLPIVADFYSGMCATAPLFAGEINGTAEDIKAIYRSLYRGPVVSYIENPDENGFLSALALSGSDRMEVSVFGNGERILLAARFDNLGKGAAGGAVENLNSMLGYDPAKGLSLN